MRSKLIMLLILVSIVCLSGIHQDIHGQPQAAKRAIREMDLFDFVWIGDPQISPDGSQVVFYRVAPNQQRTDYDGAIWIVPTSGNINHSTDLYLLDQKGELASRFNYSDGQQIIVDGVRGLIH